MIVKVKLTNDDPKERYKIGDTGIILEILNNGNGTPCAAICVRSKLHVIPFSFFEVLEIDGVTQIENNV